jgi:hypothetical protein
MLRHYLTLRYRRTNYFTHGPLIVPIFDAIPRRYRKAVSRKIIDIVSKINNVLGNSSSNYSTRVLSVASTFDVIPHRYRKAPSRLKINFLNIIKCDTKNLESQRWVIRNKNILLNQSLYHNYALFFYGIKACNRSINYANTLYRALLFCPDSPADYDELAEEETEETGGDAMKTGYGVTDEDADAILNEDDMDTCPPGPSSFRTPASETPASTTGAAQDISHTSLRYRTESTGSGSSTAKAGNSKLSSLYFSTQMARNSAIPPRVLGSGSDPLNFDRFGDLSGDPRHHLATHRHIFDSTQNISTSFDPAKMHCNSCTTPHAMLCGALVCPGWSPSASSCRISASPPRCRLGGGMPGTASQLFS